MKLNKLILLAAIPLCLHAHFTFIVPQPGAKSARLIVSETLSPDPMVSPAIAKTAKLHLRDESGHLHQLGFEAKPDYLKIDLPGKGDRLVYGQINLGMSPSLRAPKPYLLMYYPKTIIGGLRGQAAVAGKDQIVEIVPHGPPGSLELEFLVRGVAKPDAEITVVMPDGKEQRVKTNSQGIAGPFRQPGRYAVWARHWEDASGEDEGVAYEQVRHYGMLVVDSLANSKEISKLPEPASSFGAVTAGDNVYVYGGHIARTHQYSVKSVSGQFSAWNATSRTWKQLPGGPGLQGMNLAAHQGKIYRVGGMAPRNELGTKAEIFSSSEVARFDLAHQKWEALPPLPQPRSSHEPVIVGDKLVVTGGWNLRGQQEAVWSKSTLVLDLNQPASGWREIPQPFSRRALAAVALEGKVYVLGGITEKGDVTGAVNVLDLATGQWTEGPSLPAGPGFSFAPAAAVWQGAVYASLGDGRIYRLTADTWQPAAETKSRVAHRMLPSENGFLVLGGAQKGENLDLMEEVRLRP